MAGPPPKTVAARAGNRARGRPKIVALRSIANAPWMVRRPRRNGSRREPIAGRAGARRRRLRGDRQRGGGGSGEADGVDQVDEADPGPGQQQARQRGTDHQAELEQGLEHSGGRGHLGAVDEVGHDGAQGRVFEGAKPGRERRAEEDRPQRRPRRRVERQPAGDRGRDDRDDDKQAATVDGVDDRAAEERSGQQRTQCGERDQPHVQGRPGQLVHLVRHGYRGHLGAEHRDGLAGHQRPQIAGPAQRAEIDEQLSWHAAILQVKGSLNASSPGEGLSRAQGIARTSTEG